jgi:hypothetical protein
VLVVTGDGPVTVETSGSVQVVTLDLSALAGGNARAVSQLAADAADLPPELLRSALQRLAEVAGR